MGFRCLITIFFVVLCSLPSSAQFRKLSRLIKRGQFENALQFAEHRTTQLDDRKLGTYRLQHLHLTLGKLHFTLGDFAQAEKEYKTSMAFVNSRIAEEKRLKLPDFDVMDELALFYVNTGNFQQGRELVDRSLKLRIRKLDRNNPANFRPYLPMGMLLFYQDKFDSAKHYLSVYQKQIRNSNYTGFLDINRYADTYQVLAEIELKQGDWKQARKFSRKSVRLQRHPWTKRQIGRNYLGRVRALNTLSMANRLSGNPKKASAYNGKALAVYRRKYERENYALVPVYVNKAWIAMQKNEIDTTRFYLRKTIALQTSFINENFNHLSEYEKENYYTRLRDSFHEIGTIILKLYQANKIKEDDPFWSEILNYIIHTKALILNETNRMMEAMRHHDDPEIKRIFSRWQKLKNEWAFLSGSTGRKNKGMLSSIQAEIVSMEKELMTKALPLNKPSDGGNWKEVRSMLAADECAIEFARINVSGTVSDSSVVYIAFVIRPEESHPRIVLYPHGKKLEERYIKNYFNCVNFHVEDTTSFKEFWLPVSTLLDRVRRVFISPDGVFHLINADILKGSQAGDYLTDEISFVNMTNIGRLATRNQGGFSFVSAGLFGAPDFSRYSRAEKSAIGFGETISPLPGTEAEVKELSDLLVRNNVRVQTFSKEHASELQLFELADFNVLHLATHGFFNRESFGDDPMLGSGLVLAKDQFQRKDGVLTAYEASTLNLDATRLVVLSACKTGLGEVKEGEGVYGLQRAFEVAGVDHILMTLWNVDDTVTKEFMIDFYERLIQEKDVQIAFRQAQLHLKSKYPDVFYWGAFKLVSSF